MLRRAIQQQLQQHPQLGRRNAVGLNVHRGQPTTSAISNVSCSSSSLISTCLSMQSRYYSVAPTLGYSCPNVNNNSTSQHTGFLVPGRDYHTSSNSKVNVNTNNNYKPGTGFNKNNNSNRGGEKSSEGSYSNKDGGGDEDKYSGYANSLLKFSCDTLLAYCVIRTLSDDCIGVTLCIGPSMMPTLDSRGSLCFVDRISYRFRDRDYQVGDVVTCTCKTDPHKQVCKRILGCANDVIVYQRPSDLYPCTVVVPNGHVWLAGDNSQNSTDSRNYGPVPVGLLQGRLVLSIDQSFNVRFIERKSPAELAAEAEQTRQRQQQLAIAAVLQQQEAQQLQQQRQREQELKAQVKKQEKEQAVQQSVSASAKEAEIKEATSATAETSDVSKKGTDGAVVIDDLALAVKVQEECKQQQQEQHSQQQKQQKQMVKQHSLPMLASVQERQRAQAAVNISSEAFSAYDYTLIRRGIFNRTDLNQREKEELSSRVSLLAQEQELRKLFDDQFNNRSPRQGFIFHSEMLQQQQQQQHKKQQQRQHKEENANSSVTSIDTNR